MDTKRKEYSAHHYVGIGRLDGCYANEPIRRHTVIQSLWTKPVKSNERLKDILYMSALSLEYAHRNGYRVHMHTDSKGVALLKRFGYEKLVPTLDNIPDTVPTELFAAGKFFAMREEGALGKIHIDTDVFIRKAGLFDRFYKDNSVDAICQQEEDYEKVCFHDDKIRPMHILGYPATTRPNWRGSMNTGIIGFNNPILAAKYMNNYFEALEIYTDKKFDDYKKLDDKACMLLDFILEQVNLSYMSIGYNVYTLLPMHDATFVADEIGYCHLQGEVKWYPKTNDRIKSLLCGMNNKLYAEVLGITSRL